MVLAEVEIARFIRFGPTLSREERPRVLLFEVGHALGLGHASHISGIMHRATPPRFRPTD